MNATAHGIRAKHRKADLGGGGPVSLSAMGGMFAPNTQHIQRLHQDLGGGSSARDVAASGFAGGGSEVPHRQEMEASFGRDFSGVKAHTGSAAHSANESLGANAYAQDGAVAFRDPNPSKALVAHELTHVVQQTEGPSYSRDDGAVDTSGEAQAEAVEAAVAAGQPASSVLGEATQGAGTSLKKKGPALDDQGSRFGMGMTFSAEALEKSYEYTIWEGHYAIPIAAVPGLNFVIDPSVKVKAAGRADWGGENAGAVSTYLGVEGEIGVGLSYGVPDVAEVYATLNPALQGRATYRKGPRDEWSLRVGVDLNVAGKIGVKLGGGILDYAFELFDANLFKLTGIDWDNQGFHRDRIGFALGDDIRPIFDFIKSAIDKASAVGGAIVDAGATAGRYVAGAASEAWDYLTSW